MARPRKTVQPKRVPPKAPSTKPVRDPVTGKWVGRESQMRQNTFEAFKAWYDGRKPRIKTDRFEHVALSLDQEVTLKKMLKGDGKGSFQHGRVLLIWPRRHSKSNLMRLVVLWLADTREHYTIQLYGNSEAHSRTVQYLPLTRIIQQTPALRKRFPERGIMKDVIEHPNGSRIQAMVGASMVFGDQINCLWMDDVHHQRDWPSVNALKASLWDQKDSLTLISSNVDPVGGNVHQMQKAWQNNPRCYVHHLEYKSWLEYEALAPKWIDRDDMLLDQATMLPAEWDRDTLGQRTQATNCLFEIKDIDKCKMSYKAPVTDNLKELIQDRALKIGGGFDRADSLMGDKTGHDNTVLTIIAKVARLDGEPEYFVLDQVKVDLNEDGVVKRHFLDAHQRYGGLDNLCLEDHNVSGLEKWCMDQNIPVESVNPYNKRQNAIFKELGRIVKEGRLHFPSRMDELADELSKFEYSLLPGGSYRFEAGSGHDDRVYSLAWAVYSLRHVVMSIYTMGNISCQRRDKHRGFCFILGGDLELGCAHGCAAYRQAAGMYKDFLKFTVDDHLTLPQFYKKYVKHKGALIVQAA